MDEQATPDSADAENLPPTFDLASYPLNREIGRLLPEDLARKIPGVCIGQPIENMLTVVVVDPTEVSIYDLIDIGTQHQFKAQLLGGDPDQIRLAQEFIYKVPEARAQETWGQWLDTKKFENTSIDLTQSSSGGNVEVTGQTVDLADQIIKEAISVGASDIHIETFADGVLVRYRQDGVLRVVDQISDLDLGHGLVKRLKVMAKVDITQDKVTQGGRIGLQVGGRGYDLRVSIVPVPDGESIVMRVLSKSAFNTTLQDLGFSDDQMKRFRRMISRPHGLILTCGPTGAGKSTTLYASLKSIQRPDRKLLTVEDPIEYRMPGIIQVQVNRSPHELDRQVTFASAMREFLRHDPDVILVGEIRDEETARISIQAALTGHLVLSTIHTNDSVGIVNRLKDQNIKPYLIASTLIAGVAQRLVRRNCEYCKEEAVLTDDLKEFLESHQFSHSQFYAGRGCDNCRGSGFKGRVGLYELLSITDSIRDQIEKECTALELLRTARVEGMRTLVEDGLAKAAQGLVSLEEVQRVCMTDS